MVLVFVRPVTRVVPPRRGGPSLVSSSTVPVLRVWSRGLGVKKLPETVDPTWNSELAPRLVEGPGLGAGEEGTLEDKWDLAWLWVVCSL